MVMLLDIYMFPCIVDIAEVLTLSPLLILMVPPNSAATMDIIRSTPRMVRTLFLVVVFLLILRHSVSCDPLGGPPMDSGCRGSKDWFSSGTPILSDCAAACGGENV